MSSFIESTWDLRCDSSPRCLSVDLAPNIPSNSNASNSSASGQQRNSRGTSTNPFEGSSSKPKSSNPFDSFFDSPSSGSTMLSPNSKLAQIRAAQAKNSNPFADENDDDKIISSGSIKDNEQEIANSGYSVLIGTESGSVQYRTFPSPTEAHKNRNAFASTDNTISPRGYDGTSMDRVHPLHQPLDIEGTSSSPIVACIRAKPKEIVKSSYQAINIPWKQSSSSRGQLKDSKSAPTSTIYLLLQQKKQVQPKNTKAKDVGAYSAQIIALHHMTNTSTTLFSAQNLPEMSCATYHPNTGFVYAAGTSLYSLPPKAVRAISSALVSSVSNNNNNQGGKSSGRFESYQQVSSVSSVDDDLLSRPTVYFNAENILPSDSRSNQDAICTICEGRVIVVATGNAFYAVSGTSVPHGTWYTKEEEEQMEEAKGGHDVDIFGSVAGILDGDGTDEVGIKRSMTDGDDGEDMAEQKKGHDMERVLKFRQSSQVHPAIVVEVPQGVESERRENEDANINSGSISLSSDLGVEDEVFTSLVFLASGRECAIVEILYNPRLYSNSNIKRPVLSVDDPDDRNLLPSPSISCGSIVVGPPRRGIATLASPILSAVGIKSTSKKTGPLIAILTNDGMVQTRSPSCIAIPLSTIEVGTSPNDYFTLKTLPNKEVAAISYGGEGKLLLFKEDTVQDLADRMMKLCIDAFGSSGFPRAELSEAVDAKFSATSYVGPEPTNSARSILRQYLEMILGLDVHKDFNSDDAQDSFFDLNESFSVNSKSKTAHISTYISASAILALTCTKLTPMNASLASRSTKACAMKLGVVSKLERNGINSATSNLCKVIVDILLTASESDSIGIANATPTRRNIGRMEFIESATWLLRACGEHEHALAIERERMANPAVISSSNQTPDLKARSSWSQLKYESFAASHLGELWSHGDISCKELVLTSDVTMHLLESNPLLGIEVFTSAFPKSEDQWNDLKENEDPLKSLEFTNRVVQLLKSAKPLIPHDKRERIVQIESNALPQHELPLESGKALAVTYLEALIGISTKRPHVHYPRELVETVSEVHNELALLLLEGVLSERSDDESAPDSTLGAIYRSKLRRLLGWPSACVHPDKLMTALPESFLRERALVLGQLGRHDDALRIFYCKLKSLDLALEYCDARYEKQQAQMNRSNRSPHKDRDLTPLMSCPYLPLISVALDATEDPTEGIDAAIKVLSLRRQNIDRSAALRLLPRNIPISTLSKSFLVPALIDGESKARRMEVVSSLLKAKYVKLKQALTEAQIKSQSSINTVPGLRSLNLGDPIYVSKPFKARPSSNGLSYFPDITITKYFFNRFVVIQSTVQNSSPGISAKTLGDLQLIIAESSDDALIPSINIAVKILPSGMKGSSWCVLAASPQRLDGSAILTCEFRYKIVNIDIATGAPLNFDEDNGMFDKLFVEEIQDIEIRRAEFEG